MIWSPFRFYTRPEQFTTLLAPLHALQFLPSTLSVKPKINQDDWLENSNSEETQTQALMLWLCLIGCDKCSMTPCGGGEIPYPGSLWWVWSHLSGPDLLYCFLSFPCLGCLPLSFIVLGLSCRDFIPTYPFKNTHNRQKNIHLFSASKPNTAQYKTL